MVTWSKEFTLEFIELLHSLECLWDMQHPDYHKSAVRKVGYDKLVQKVRELDPQASIDDIKRKIKGLRTNLKKMERRVLEYQKCGLNHIPSLFYYEPLSFLLTQDRSRASGAAEAKSNESMEDFHLTDCSQEEENVTMTVNEDGTLTITEDSDGAASGDVEMSRVGVESQRHCRTNGNKRKASTREILDAEVFGNYVAAKLVSVSKLQRVYLEKIINDAIFEAELGNLTINSRLCKDKNDERFYVSLNDPQNYNEVIIGDVESIAPTTKSELVYEIEVEPHSQESRSTYEDDSSEGKMRLSGNHALKTSIGTYEVGHPTVSNGGMDKSLSFKNNMVQQIGPTNNGTEPENSVSFDNVQFIDDPGVDQVQDGAITVIYVEGSNSVEKL